VSEDRPSLFVAYANERYERSVTGRLKRKLASRGIDLYRLIEDSRIGERWTQAAERKISEADGVVVIWTKKALKSRVVDEYRFARKIDKPICLVREDNVPLPPDWPEDMVYAPLRGLSPAFIILSRLVAGPSLVSSEDIEFNAMLDQITVFAWRQAALSAVRRAGLSHSS